MKTISNLTDKQLTSKIENLLKEDFRLCKILNSYTSKTITLKCNFNEMEYNTNVYLEEITNPKYKYQITVGTDFLVPGTDSFPYSEEGIKQVVDYINY
tara:strand:+ start:237 stop:530 length:294 start_codon:yes stop_codon:yes gene_type:complete